MRARLLLHRGPRPSGRGSAINPQNMQKITPFLWFDKEAGEAAKLYTSLFKDSKVQSVTTLHDTPSGTVEIVNIELSGQEFALMSAGPLFKFTPAVSFLVGCNTKEEVDAAKTKDLTKKGPSSMPPSRWKARSSRPWIALMSTTSLSTKPFHSL